MVPDKFNMVDMEGIDILFRYGDSIPGLYQKLVESIAPCRYQCLYNWYFDSVLIPPTYVEMTVIDNKVWIGDGVSIDEEDTLRFLAPGLKSVTGAIAHITDALARKADQIMCYINPEQDLHGYDHPWIGGAGRNLYAPPSSPIVSAGVTLTPNADGSIRISGPANTAPAMFFALVDIPAETQITFSLNNASVNAEVGIRVISTTNAGPGTQWGTSVLADAVNKTFTMVTEFDAKSINVFAKTNHGPVDITLKVMVELGDTASPFEPYANICPIIGWTGVDVYSEASYDVEANPTITVDWQDQADIVYGALFTLNDGGCTLSVTDGNIASYNGETLPSTWISSMDVYAEGATPTIGAQVVYKLAEPIIYNLTAPHLPILLQGENYLWHNANGDISVTYWYNKI